MTPSAHRFAVLSRRPAVRPSHGRHPLAGQLLAARPDHPPRALRGAPYRTRLPALGPESTAVGATLLGTCLGRRLGAGAGSAFPEGGEVMVRIDYVLTECGGCGVHWDRRSGSRCSWCGTPALGSDSQAPADEPRAEDADESGAEPQTEVE